jgi:hypothetical protein
MCRAASTSKKRNKELPCLLMCPSRCLPALESSLGIFPCRCRSICHEETVCLAKRSYTYEMNDLAKS